MSGHWNERLELENYFNSGVMLLNLERMRQNKITAKLLEYKRNETDKSFMDQNALNVCFGNNVLFIDKKFNFLCTLRQSYTKEQIEDYFNMKYEISDIVIYHLTGSQKVWENAMHKDFELYTQYLDSKEFIILCPAYFAKIAEQIKELQDRNSLLEKNQYNMINSKPWRGYQELCKVLRKLRMVGGGTR